MVVGETTSVNLENEEKMKNWHSQKIGYQIMATALGMLFVSYLLALQLDMVVLRKFSSLAFIGLSVLWVASNIKEAREHKKEKDGLHFLLLAIMLMWFIRNLSRFIFNGSQSAVLLGVMSVFSLILAFLTVLVIFLHYAKQLNTGQIVLDSLLIQGVLITLATSAANFLPEVWKLSAELKALTYAYYFFELLKFSLAIGIFTSFRERKLSRQNVLILLSLLVSAVVQGFFEAGRQAGVEMLNFLAASLYLLPVVGLLFASQRMKNNQESPLFEEKYRDDKLLENPIKSYVFILLTMLSFAFYMKSWISSYAIFFIVLMLMAYYIMNRSYQRQQLAEYQLKMEESKRRLLEQEVEERTREIMQRNAELKAKNELLADIIYFDMNLELHTIRYLQENLSKWNQEKSMALIVIDIKGFKNINSLFSYAVGDQVLTIVADRLKRLYEEKAIRFRLNSNKFGLLFLREMEREELIAHIQSVHSLGKEPINVGEVAIHIEFSIGVAAYEKNAPDAQRILENAEYAEREARQMIEENAFQIFDREIAKKVEREQSIRSLLERIDFDEEFELYYQPQCDVSGKLLGMEALLRWKNPEMGWISPGEFIPIAEGSAVILKIARWTLRKGVEQIKLWNTRYQTDYRLGVNISTKFIENASFLRYLQDIIAEYQIPPKWLDLEITETSLMNVSEDIICLFKELSELGVSISIDDFGTGYSSLSYINSFEISNIKIARELVDEIVDNPKESALVKAIITMANSLELDIIAEGVEEKKQLQTLASLGCDKIQGYYFGKPQSAEDFENNFIPGSCSVEMFSCQLEKNLVFQKEHGCCAGSEILGIAGRSYKK